MIGDEVLAAQLVANVLERLGEVINAVGKEDAPAGVVGELLENMVAGGFVHLVRLIAFECKPIGVGADGVNGSLGALNHLDSIAAGVVAEVVVTVTDDHQDAAHIDAGWKRGGDELLRSLEDGVAKGGSAA